MNVVDASFVVTESNLSVVSVGIPILHVSQQQQGNLVAQGRVTCVHCSPVSVGLLQMMSDFTELTCRCSCS